MNNLFLVRCGDAMVFHLTFKVPYKTQGKKVSKSWDENNKQTMINPFHVFHKSVNIKIPSN